MVLRLLCGKLAVMNISFLVSDDGLTGGGIFIGRPILEHMRVDPAAGTSPPKITLAADVQLMGSKIHDSSRVKTDLHSTYMARAQLLVPKCFIKWFRLAAVLFWVYYLTQWAVPHGARRISNIPLRSAPTTDTSPLTESGNVDSGTLCIGTAPSGNMFPSKQRLSVQYITTNADTLAMTGHNM